MAVANLPVGARSYRVVVADEFRAIFYDREKKLSPLRDAGSMQNDTAREKTGDLLADRGGRAFDSHGKGRHTMEGADPKAQAAVAFAKAVADRLATDHGRGQYDLLVVVAAPRFLGILRPALSAAGVESEREFDKAVTGQGADFIQRLIDSA